MTTTEDQNALALMLAREWNGVVLALTESAVSDAEVVVSIELKPDIKMHPFYAGKISLLMYLRALVDADIKRFESGSKILDELALWRDMAGDIVEALGTDDHSSDCPCFRCGLTSQIKLIIRGWDESKKTTS